MTLCKLYILVLHLYQTDEFGEIKSHREVMFSPAKVRVFL